MIIVNQKNIILPKIERVYCKNKIIYSAGPIYVNKPAVNFGYTSGIQTYTVPETGLYKLTLNGAVGGNGRNGNGGSNSSTKYAAQYGGRGGQTICYTILEKGETLYIVNGGAGNLNLTGDYSDGGYNGGGRSAANSSSTGYSGGGGGATHVARTSGLLGNVVMTNLLAVAGGGGGAAGHRYYAGNTLNGGTGGGAIGGNGLQGLGGSIATGGTQTSGGGPFFKGSYGKGADCTSGNYTGGGGGGLFGGGGSNSQGTAGGGGSGWIPNSVTVFKKVTFTNSTTNGVNSGNGSTSIQLIAV